MKSAEPISAGLESARDGSPLRAQTTVILVLPAYNEAASLPGLLRQFEAAARIGGYRGRVVVADDGSTDGTPEILAAWEGPLRIDALRYRENRGLGAVIRDGLLAAAALAQPEDVIVTMDADNTHSPALIAEMLHEIASGSDIVIASRFRPGSRVVGLSRSRVAMSWGARALFRLLTPIPGVRDYTCGFRAFRAALIQEALQSGPGALITEKSFACTAELLMNLAKRRRIRIHEIPFVLRYDRKGSASKMRIARTIAGTFRMAWRSRSSRAEPNVPLYGLGQSKAPFPGMR